MNNKIVIVQKSCVSYYPPLIAFLQILKKNNIDVILICGFEYDSFKPVLDTLCSKVFYLNVNIAQNQVQRMLSWLNIRRKVWALLEKENLLKELFYLPTADTVLAMGKKVKKLNYILNLYELFDNIPYYFKNLKQYAMSANCITCPDRTRAHMFKVWWNLKDLPFVIPNRPIARPNFIPDEIPSEVRTIVSELENTKFVIYQGIITPDRNLVPLCKAIEGVKDFRLVVMGRSTDYLEQLKTQYPHIFHIPFITPPYHLYVTQKARLGILSYDYSCLNNIFCAPNKIWEYASIGLPMLGNDIPGLYNVIDANELGVCVNFDNTDAIRNAIVQIDSSYDTLSSNSYNYFDSVDLEDSVNVVLRSVKLK